jgi:hypothetical protein
VVEEAHVTAITRRLQQRREGRNRRAALTERDPTRHAVERRPLDVRDLA